jgi:hypothetical protein
MISRYYRSYDRAYNGRGYEFGCLYAIGDELNDENGIATPR